MIKNRHEIVDTLVRDMIILEITEAMTNLKALKGI